MTSATRTPNPVGTKSASVVGIVLVVLAGSLMLVAGWGRISAVFGDSDEGINGAVWAANSQALRQDGIVDSRLGGVRGDNTLYASHPPAIVIETAVAETIGGQHEWVSRAAAWVGSLVALALLYRLLRAARLDPLVAGGATAATAATSMFLVYGPMLDTPVTSFPFGVAVVLVWYRQWQADPGTWAVHPAWLAGLAALAAVAGWQALLLVALCGLSMTLRGLRGRRGAMREALPLVVGGAIGLGLSLAWTRWVYGDLSVLVDKYSVRSGASQASDRGIGDMIGFQLPWLVQLLAVGIVGLGGCLVALRDATLRPLAAMSLTIVGLYALVFHQAAGGHQFWNYWALLPTAVGFGYLFRTVAADARDRAPVVIVSFCLVIALVNVAGLPSLARLAIDEGHAVVEAFVGTTYPEGQSTAWYVGQPYRPDAWIAYYSDLAPQEIATRTQLDDLARTDPEALVLVLEGCGAPAPPSELCASLQDSGRPVPVSSIVSAADLAKP